MASPQDVWQTLKNCLIAQTATFRPPLLTSDGQPSIFIDLADGQIASQVAKSQCGAVISIFDFAQSSDSTRYLRRQSGNYGVNPIGVSSVASGRGILYAGGALTITITGTPLAGDGVSCNLTYGQNMATASAKAVTGSPTDTPTTMAAALAASVNSNDVMNTLVTAAASGAIVTITNIAGEAMRLSTGTGNTGFTQYEIGRTRRPVLIKLMAATYPQRDAIGKIIKSTLQQLAKQTSDLGNQLAKTYNLMPDGTWVRVDYNSDRIGRANHQIDLFCWDFIIDVDFADVVVEDKWSVLGFNSTYEGAD